MMDVAIAVGLVSDARSKTVSVVCRLEKWLNLPQLYMLIPVADYPLPNHQVRLKIR
jgi:hypothetical protein